jgi:hypothetical protein
MDDFNNAEMVIGNKPFKNLHIGKFIDKFNNINRCNLGLPFGNNGTKFGSLGLCNHLSRYITTEKLPKEQFKKMYGKVYKQEEMETFFLNFDPKKFDEVYYAKSVNTHPIYNHYLKSISCPCGLIKDPRTGYSIVLKKIKENKTVFISHFTILQNETRHSWYVQEGKADSVCHDKVSELNILRWLHKNGKIDASLCLLKDSEKIEFIDDELKPTPFIVNILNEIYK